MRYSSCKVLPEHKQPWTSWGEGRGATSIGETQRLLASMSCCVQPVDGEAVQRALAPVETAPVASALVTLGARSCCPH